MKIDFPLKVYFYCPPESSDISDNKLFPYQTICLGEGLKQLGVEIYANTNFWRISPEKEEYLFNANPRIQPDDCNIVVINDDWLSINNWKLPNSLFCPDRKYITVHLHKMDEVTASRRLLSNSKFSQFDFIFKSHFASKFRYPPNFHSLPFGISERILRETQIIPDFQTRNKQIVVNFRHHQGAHSVRKKVHQEFDPVIQTVLPINSNTNKAKKPPADPYHYLRCIQTGWRHYPDYYELLKRSAACSCFAGWFVSPWLKSPNSFAARLNIRSYKLLGLKSQRILQWDSWRFWESLAAGCATFHLDFEKYGILLPVMPENWKHYIGVDLDNIPETIDRLVAEPDLLERVAGEGRKWAIEHYSPVPTALRFLETVVKRPLSLTSPVTFKTKKKMLNQFAKLNR